LEKAVIVYCMINAVSLKNTLFTENMLKKKERESRFRGTSSTQASEMMKLLPLFVFWGLWYLIFPHEPFSHQFFPDRRHFSISHGEAGGLSPPLPSVTALPS
jgi:hypothetical protein